jgi:hypothetical protein
MKSEESWIWPVTTSSSTGSRSVLLASSRPIGFVVVKITPVSVARVRVTLVGTTINGPTSIPDEDLGRSETGPRIKLELHLGRSSTGGTELTLASSRSDRSSDGGRKERLRTISDGAVNAGSWTGEFVDQDVAKNARRSRGTGPFDRQGARGQMSSFNKMTAWRRNSR